jgi:hypothetical protein
MINKEIRDENQKSQDAGEESIKSNTEEEDSISIETTKD